MGFTDIEFNALEQEFNSMLESEKIVFYRIAHELIKATEKHPNWPVGDVVHASAIVAEESGELIRAALQAKYEGGKYSETTKEAIQTGAMAVRFILNY